MGIQVDLKWKFVKVVHIRNDYPYMITINEIVYKDKECKIPLLITLKPTLPPNVGSDEYKKHMPSLAEAFNGPQGKYQFIYHGDSLTCIEIEGKKHKHHLAIDGCHYFHDDK